MIFIGDDWAEDHHDVYLMDEAGQRLASRRLPEGLTGIRQLHAGRHRIGPPRQDAVEAGLWITMRARQELGSLSGYTGGNEKRALAGVSQGPSP